MLGDSLRGITLTFACMPSSKEASRLTSSMESFVSARSTYSNVIRRRRWAGNRRQTERRSVRLYFRFMGTSRLRSSSVVACNEIARLGMIDSEAKRSISGI